MLVWSLCTIEGDGQGIAWKRQLGLEVGADSYARVIVSTHEVPW